MTEKKGIRFIAVLLGALTDNGCSLVCGLGYGIMFGIVLGVMGIPIDEGTRSPLFLIPSLFLGFGGTVLGGYVAGRVARQSEILHGGIVGALGILMGLLFKAALPLWFNVVSFVGVLPFGMAGGYIARWQRERAENRPQDTKKMPVS
jgi:hypothetical protein